MIYEVADCFTDTTVSVEQRAKYLIDDAVRVWRGRMEKTIIVDSRVTGQPYVIQPTDDPYRHLSDIAHCLQLKDQATESRRKVVALRRTR